MHICIQRQFQLFHLACCCKKLHASLQASLPSFASCAAARLVHQNRACTHTLALIYKAVHKPSQTDCLWSAGTSNNKCGSWMQLSTNRGTTASGNLKQPDPASKQASQGLADITNQAARLHASKAHAQSQIHADSPSTSQFSTGRGSNTPQQDPQQDPKQALQLYPQTGSTGDHTSKPLASTHSPEPAAIPSRPRQTTDTISQAGTLPNQARDLVRQAGALPNQAEDPARQADQAESHAASTLQASLLSHDHAEPQQQQRLVNSNSNLPRIVGLSSTLCLLDIPDLGGPRGKHGKLALAAERVRSFFQSFPLSQPIQPLYTNLIIVCCANMYYRMSCCQCSIWYSVTNSQFANCEPAQICTALADMQFYRELMTLYLAPGQLFLPISIPPLDPPPPPTPATPKSRPIVDSSLWSSCCSHAHTHLNREHRKLYKGPLGLPPPPSAILPQTEQQVVVMQAPARHVGFWAACCIPEVAFTLFFCKLVAYTFLYSMPYCINSVTIASTKLSPQVGFVVLSCSILKTDSYLLLHIFFSFFFFFFSMPASFFSPLLLLNFLFLRLLAGCWQPVSVI